MESPEENPIGGGETTQIACIPLIWDFSPLACRAKEILRNGGVVVNSG